MIMLNVHPLFLPRLIRLCFQFTSSNSASTTTLKQADDVQVNSSIFHVSQITSYEHKIKENTTVRKFTLTIKH